MRRFLFVLLLALPVLGARQAAAQSRTETAFAPLPAPALTADTTPLPGRPPGPYPERVLVRGGAAMLGGVLGAVVIGAIGYSLDNSGGEEAHLMGTVYGATLGGIVGAAAGAAFPRSATGRCGFGRRFAQALVGTYLATSLGVGVAWAMDPAGEDGGYALLLVGVGGALVGAIAAEC
ncbi:MAG TPA: hypothetical protein VFQ39_17130 [Longimicrobium sp.]|nr:hypothetical protein [Longimicrobium sp.]